MTVFCLLLVSLSGLRAEPPDPEGLRIVLVGDSITGQSRNYSKGFAHVMEDALTAAAPDRDLEIVALGGSGQSVPSWLSVAERSKSEKSVLDVKGIDVQVELAKPADVLVVMLGMNDVIAPYVSDSEESLDRWIANYEKLVEGLRVRVRPEILALAGITPYTEEPLSPGNQLIDRMNKRVRHLAEKMGGRFVGTSEKSKEILREGRSLNPEFHVTNGDCVHPGEAGHLAIAEAILDSLGETKAADWLVGQKLDPLMESIAGKSSGVSWERVSAVREPDSSDFVFKIRYTLTGKWAGAKDPVYVVAPEGWKADPEVLSEASGEFSLTGNPDRLTNAFFFRSGQTEERGEIPAPWLVTAGVQSKWDGNEFDAEKNRSAMDEFIRDNRNVASGYDADGKLDWRPYFASVNFTGGANADSVDFVAITHPSNFEAGYGVRWIYSEKDRAVHVAMNSRIFAGNIHLSVWANGEEAYQGLITEEPKKTKLVAAKLKRGWNELVFKASHRAWLWQVSVGLGGTDGDSLDDLRFGLEPPDSHRLKKSDQSR